MKGERQPTGGHFAPVVEGVKFQHRDDVSCARAYQQVTEYSVRRERTKRESDVRAEEPSREGDDLGADRLERLVGRDAVGCRKFEEKIRVCIQNGGRETKLTLLQDTLPSLRHHLGVAVVRHMEDEQVDFEQPKGSGEKGVQLKRGVSHTTGPAHREARRTSEMV